MSTPGSRTVRQPRVVVQTTSDIDILDDGKLMCFTPNRHQIPLTPNHYSKITQLPKEL
ncbi:hypothetical protein JHK82_055572 [Glycine max]|nr:hypothetical protein JHK82_055572 [Glycine max]